MTDSFVRLRAAGVNTKLAFDIVTAGADAIAAFGGTSEELRRFSIGMQQVFGKGVLSMEELRQQIGEALPVAMRVFASQTGRSISEVISDVEKGRISAQEFGEELAAGLKKAFGGFSQKLGDTLLGSIQGLKSKIQKAFSGDLFQKDVAIRITAIIQNAGEALKKFLETLTTADVDKFFQTLKNGFKILVGIGRAIVIIGKAIVALFNFLAELASPTGIGTVGAFGAIGFKLFGPLGGLGGILAGLVAVSSGVNSIKGAVKNLTGIEILDEGLGERAARLRKAGKDPFAEGASLADKAREDQKKKGGIFEGIFDITDKQLTRISASIKEVSNPTKKLAIAVQGLGKTGVEAQKQLEGFAKSTAAALAGKETFPFVKTAETAINRLTKIIEGFDGPRKMQAKLAAMVQRSPEQEAQFSALNTELSKMDMIITKVRENISRAKGLGFARELFKANDAAGAILSKFGKLVGGTSELQQKINSIRENFRDMKDELQKQLDIQLRLTDTLGFETAMVQKLKDALASITAERKKQINLARAQAEIDGKILEINSKLVIMQTSKKITDLKRETRGAFETLTSSDLGDEAANRRAELNREIEQTKIRILETQQKINAAIASGDPISDLEAQEFALERLQEQQQKSLAATTAAAMAAQQLWSSVRDTMVQAAEQGLKGLITGTKTFKEVTRDAFNSITDAAIKYLIELVRIKIQTIALNAINNSSGSGGQSFASVIGQFFASANGNAVKKFANGGIASQIGNVVRGPTMFGLAGEAGPEGILPLANVGGKLGVRSTGGGGDQFHITIQAIDTQSGAQFIHNNAPSIVNMLRNEIQKNGGVAKVR